jgi:hypothetical protein
MSNLEHFAIMDIGYFHAPTSLTITTSTNNPCHLTCYYTHIPPRKHHTTRIVRGLTVPWGVYFCFVAWKAVEQNEAGDTLTHTFDIPDWSYCQIKYFTFRGTISGEISPSVGPLFIHHHSGVGPARFEYYNIDDDTGHILSFGYFQAQTFTPLASHKITSVWIKAYRVGLPGTITAGIRETVDGFPTNTDLCIGTTPGNTFTTDTDGEWREIEIVDGVDLSANVQYAQVAKALDGFVLNYLVWRADSTGPSYDRGMFLTSGDYGETWTKWPISDKMFEEWGIAI